MKTAVEWLIKELPKGDFDQQQIIIKQAMELEKEQIRNAFYDGGYIGFYHYKTFENYYNETFKK